jgi:hypothetical protein
MNDALVRVLAVLHRDYNGTSDVRRASMPIVGHVLVLPYLVAEDGR